MFSVCFTEHIKSHLSYPHIWVQLASSQLFGLLFAAWQPEELVAMETDSSKEYLAIDTASKVRDGDLTMLRKTN